VLGGKKFAGDNKCCVQVVAGKWWCMVSGSGW